MNPEPPDTPPADKPSEPKPPASDPAPPKPPAAAKPAAPAAAKPPAGAAPKPPAAPPKPAEMVTAPWESELTQRVSGQFGAAVKQCVSYLGQNFVVVEAEVARGLIEYLKLEEDFDYLVDITAVDYPAKEERFELIYILYSFQRNERIRVKTRIKEGQKPQTMVPVHLTANWLEREVYDMFGIEFAGHPDLRRILMPDDWRGYPLRKDYPILNMDNRWVQENLGIESGQ